MTESFSSSSLLLLLPLPRHRQKQQQEQQQQQQQTQAQPPPSPYLPLASSSPPQLTLPYPSSLPNASSHPHSRPRLLPSHSLHLITGFFALISLPPSAPPLPVCFSDRPTDGFCPKSETKSMGEESRSDVERKGSMGKRWGSSKGVYPVQDSFQSPQAAYIPEERRRYSLIVPFVVVVNVIMFIITMYVNNCPKNGVTGTCVARFLGRFSFQPLSENPLLGPSSLTLQKLGALDTNKVIHDHQGWRLITCIWLHAGVVHVLANMLSLLFIGIRLEQEFGFLKIGIIYLVSGLGGSLLSALFLQNRISVGASGALFGLLGAMLSELLTNWTIYANKCAALTTLVLVVALNLAVGILPHVDNFAHIGGFISGFLLGFVLLLRPQFGWVNRAKMPPGYEVESPAASKHKLYQYILCGIAFVIVIAGFVTVLVLVLRGVDGNKKCSWCHYMSCVPTSRWNCDDTSTALTCTTDISGNVLEVTCQSNNKTMSYPYTNQSDSVLQQLCTQLCS